MKVIKISQRAILGDFDIMKLITANMRKNGKEELI